MKTNDAGLVLIETLESEYELDESRTSAEKAVNLYVKPRITHNQFSALVPLVMQIGIDTFRRSQLLKLINKISPNNLHAIRDQFDTYIYETADDGKRSIDPFLVKQREFEKELFRQPEQLKLRKRKELYGKSGLRS